jgi:glutamate-1-semialdehyde 2,1-aminomutase|tara:strand:- start:136 stop:1437 length:1302 start_codon:yes stop_codon:yes gene_type:complete
MKLKKNKRWQKAVKIIPGGNMLYSKRAEVFLPEFWPTYFSKTKDVFVWDLDGNKYTDMIFAVGTNVLGYNNLTLEKDIIRAVKKGNMSTLNCYEEVQLTQELLKIDKWAGMVKYARTGAEANSIAIRIAKSFQKSKPNIAACGYHGWHDWYLSSNLSNRNNLNYHLLKNVKTAGVNSKLKNTTFLFRYNDIDRLEYLLKNKKIGIIKMEVERTIKPDIKFLKKVRNLANKYNAVLIFDECTSGFRETLGGVFNKYKIFPDIVTYGKAIGNGHAITAVVARKKFLRAAEDTFVSSTFWSERIGFVAALSTINMMKSKKIFQLIKKIGKDIKYRWLEIAKKNNIEIEIFGKDSIPQFKFKNSNQIYKTYFTQEMLKKNFLASNTVYVSIAHKKNVLNRYFKIFDKIFKNISTNDLKKIKSSIKGEIAHTEINRLN